MTTPSLILRQQLQAINRQLLHYALDTAEKDYYIAVALTLIADSPLSSLLVFKGGTAIYHCYLPQHRFSEDIDFSTLRREGLSLATVKTALEREGIFAVRKEFVSEATIKIDRLRYPGILDQPGAIRVEIDHLQNVVLPPQMMAFQNVWDIPITLQVMDIREICAEKIRAASQRARYRDFYDLYLIFEQYQFDLEQVLALVRQKEVRRPITSEAMRNNWQRAVQDLNAGIDPVEYSRHVPSAEIERFIAQIRFSPILPPE